MSCSPSDCTCGGCLELELPCRVASFIRSTSSSVKLLPSVEVDRRRWPDAPDKGDKGLGPGLFECGPGSIIRPSGVTNRGSDGCSRGN